VHEFDPREYPISYAVYSNQIPRGTIRRQPEGQRHTVKSLLLGKLGGKEYDRLMSKLRKVAK
jgi:hypothetical protein